MIRETAQKFYVCNGTFCSTSSTSNAIQRSLPIEDNFCSWQFLRAYYADCCQQCSKLSKFAAISNIYSTRSVEPCAELVVPACMDLGQQRIVTQGHTNNFVLVLEPSSIAEKTHKITRAGGTRTSHKNVAITAFLYSRVSALLAIHLRTICTLLGSTKTDPKEI